LVLVSISSSWAEVEEEEEEEVSRPKGELDAMENLAV